MIHVLAIYASKIKFNKETSTFDYIYEDYNWDYSIPTDENSKKDIRYNSNSAKP